ncbi:Lichenan permease iic component, partial [human gut metagenome]
MTINKEPINSNGTASVMPSRIATKTGNGVPTAFLASQGLFVAIILGLVNGYIYQWFINHNVQIKMPDGVPPAVSKSFSAIIP